jgi:hypothetical protein
MSTALKIDEDNQIKYPKSINNIQCIGPCYEANSIIIHPITLDEFTNDRNFCPTDSYVINSKKGEKNIDHTDLCYMPTVSQKDISKVNDMLRQQLIAPTFKFSSNYFLRIYYDIGSLEDGIDWLDKNKESPYRTRERVFNQIMILHGDNLNIVDHRTVNFIRDVMIHNSSQIFKGVYRFIDVDNKKIVLINPDNSNMDNSKDNDSNNKMTKDNIGLITSYIKTKFLGESEISRFISKFLRYKPEYMNKPYFSRLIVKNMIEYITRKIEMTLKN